METELEPSEPCLDDWVAQWLAWYDYHSTTTIVQPSLIYYDTTLYYSTTTMVQPW